MAKKATLKFGAGHGMSGFPAWNTSGFNDRESARVIRELLQNSLDAAAEADERTARIRFRVTKIRPKDVPSMKEYKCAFKNAIKDNEKQAGGELPAPAQLIADNIKSALGDIADGDSYMLSVMDNGIGLNESRMTSLLSDGSSAKPSHSAGSYGVGHFAAMSASDLRYVLYGGLSKNGVRIASGFTLLAGRYGREHPISAHGYLVDKILGGAKDGRLYEFFDRAAIPPVISRALDEIEQEWGHGSVVAILGFNNFGSQKGCLREIVSVVSAYNFSAAIHDENLILEVDEKVIEDGAEMHIGKNELANILEGERDRQRSYRSDSISPFAGLRPSGKNAWAAYKVLSNGVRHEVETGLGRVDIALTTPAPAGTTRIDLFRNGMWITDGIPRLGAPEFTGQRSFHAVLLPRSGGDLHRLIRNAEGPMHDSLSFVRLSDKDRKDLIRAFRRIRDWIKSQVPKIDDEQYTPEDFLVVSSDGEGSGGTTDNYTFWTAPVVVRRFNVNRARPGGTQAETDPDEADRTPDTPSVAERPRTRGVTRAQPLPFRSTVVPMGWRRHGIEIVCGEVGDEIMLRLRVDENVDATCERVLQDEYLAIASVAVEDAKGRIQADVGNDGTEIRLRGVQANTTYRLTVEHDRPADLEAVSAPVFKVDLYKAPRVEEGGKSDDS